MDHKIPLTSPYSLCFQSKTFKNYSSKRDENTKNEPEIDRFIASLPNEEYLYKYQGFWFSHPYGLLGVLSCRKNFIAKPTDIIVVTVSKVGTTWLKALAFAALNRNNSPLPVSTLHSFNPHECVPFLEYMLYAKPNVLPDFSLLPSPRLLGTHLPYTLLPPALEPSGCKIVYLCRNPRDTFVSMWHFYRKYLPEDMTIAQYFKSFSAGVHLSGPFLDHVLGYWQASQKYPDKIMFMRYEELTKDTKKEFMCLAEFMGCKFSNEEMEGKLVEKLIKMCSLREMKGLEVNKKGETFMGEVGVDNKMFFRRGEVGDWQNHLSPEMVESLDKMVEEKLRESGLSFQECYAKSA